MIAQGRRSATGPVWADWFLELEELLEREGSAGVVYGTKRRRSGYGGGRKARR